MHRNLIKFLIAAISVCSTVNKAFSQTQQPPYQVIIDGDGFSSFNGNDYTFVTIFLNNNTNETLYFRGSDCYNTLFDLKNNPYFHLAHNACKSTGYSKMAIPPHRSQKIRIFLSMDKKPAQDVSLEISMKLYRWTDNKNKWNEKDKLPGRLSDILVVHYNSDHREYYPLEEFDMADKKRKNILPNKDIYLLTDNDRKLYTLTVEKSKISKPRDTVIGTFKNNKWGKSKVKAVTIPVILHNNSEYTLRFCSMSCSWYDFWNTDRYGVRLSIWGCDANFPIVETVAPHGEYKKNLNIIYDAKIKAGSSYRVSMSLLKVSGDLDRTLDSWPGEYARFNKIWSDVVLVQ